MWNHCIAPTEYGKNDQAAEEKNTQPNQLSRYDKQCFAFIRKQSFPLRREYARLYKLPIKIIYILTNYQLSMWKLAQVAHKGNAI